MEEGRTRFPAEESNGLGELTFFHPPRTFALTPASLIALQAIAQNQHLLSGSDLGMDRAVLIPDLTLWRSRADGSDRMQLAFAPTQAFLPRWSPDGTQIAYTDLQPGKPAKIFRVSRDDGTPEEILPKDGLNQVDPTWSPDGSTIVFGRSHQDPALAIYSEELKTHALGVVPFQALIVERHVQS